MPASLLDESTLNGSDFKKPDPKPKNLSKPVGKKANPQKQRIMNDQKETFESEDDAVNEDLDSFINGIMNGGDVEELEDEEIAPEHQDDDEVETEIGEADFFRSMFGGELKDVTKALLYNSPEGQAFLQEIISELGVSSELSPLEEKCLTAIKEALNQCQDQSGLELEVIIRQKPISLQFSL